MSPELDPGMERAYRYHAGWKVIGCAVLVFGGIGALGVTLMPIGCDMIRNGDKAVGSLIAVGCLLAASMLLLAVAGAIIGVRNTIQPPLLVVTPTSLRLPPTLCGSAVKTRTGEEVPPPQPEEIPFTAIRWVRNEGGPAPAAGKLLIVHDLSPTTLAIEQSLMWPREFEELEVILRAAVPAAFTPAPPPPPAQ